MKYYLVKTISTATEENPSFKGSIDTYYSGKKRYCLKELVEGSYSRYVDSYDYICKYNLDMYGYKSEAMAKRSYNYKHPENCKLWTCEVSIECIDV